MTPTDHKSMDSVVAVSLLKHSGAQYALNIRKILVKSQQQVVNNLTKLCTYFVPIAVAFAEILEEEILLLLTLEDCFLLLRYPPRSWSTIK